MSLPKEIFKAYDIRGIVGKTFTAEIVEAIGHAIGSEAVARGQKEICIGRDGRLSGPDMAAALARGIQQGRHRRRRSRHGRHADDLFRGRINSTPTAR